MILNVAIVGGGPSGLSAAKAIAEQGMHPTVFEKYDEIGGVWRSKDGSTWSNMTTNLSKYFVSFSDFPWSISTPLFPTTEQVCQYLHDYVEKFNLKQYLKCSCKVTWVTQVENNKWLVKWLCLNDNKTCFDIFDCVILATGLYSSPYIPQLNNKNEFKGQIHLKIIKIYAINELLLLVIHLAVLT